MTSPVDSVSFYIVAHADDWQLFMFPEVFHDIRNDNVKTVIIVTTAGDAGMDENYRRAREEGCKSSVRLCLIDKAETAEEGLVKKVRGRILRAWRMENVTCYFLAIPDGGISGEGFQVNRFESLKKLYDNEIEYILSFDGNAYSNGQFTDLLRNIILSESADCNNKTINCPAFDVNENPDDHSDHWATGNFVKSCNLNEGFHYRFYCGYSNEKKVLLPNTELFWKTAMFSAYHNTVLNMSGYNTLSEGPLNYQDWCLRKSYFVNR